LTSRITSASLASRPRRRCPWARGERDVRYHDEEWGVPLHDDRALFELLTLEGAQAGLSWSTILDKRDGYRRAFADFDAARVARFGPDRVARLLQDPGIVRHRGKIEATVGNARAFLEVRRREGTFDAYVWSFVGGRPRHNAWRSARHVPAVTAESRAMSRALARDGFRFVGPTICYAFMQAAGMVNDHLVSCFRHAEIRRVAGAAPRRVGPAAAVE
jgi:DNA-3-methyladenine glycosylase I